MQGKKAVGSFTSWSRATQRGWSGGGATHYKSYDFDIFVSYASPDKLKAEEISNALVRDGLRVFYAPKTFSYDEAKGTDRPGGWSGTLEIALLSSCHYVGLISEYFDKTAWCQLEYFGFTNIRRTNTSRKLYLYPSGSDESPLVSYSERDKVVKSISDLLQSLAIIKDSEMVKVGGVLSPESCFSPLPLAMVPFTWEPWDDASYAPDPPYRVFEELVREIMVRILKKMPESLLSPVSSQTGKWQQHHIEAAIFAAKSLIEMGVSPYD